MDFPGRWSLGSPFREPGERIDPRTFTRGAPSEWTEALFVKPSVEGTPLDFTFAAFDMPVATRELAERLQQLSPDEIQLFPIRVIGSDQEHRIVNFTQIVSCLNEARTHVEFWSEKDGRPDKIGQYSLVSEIHVDPTKIGNHKIFRLGGWKIAVICSQEVKDLFEQYEATGARFWKAS
jgi:hypothetical protein